MSNYTKSTNFATKDALSSGNALKIVKGTEIDTEFNNIATAIATKSDSTSPTFTGTMTYGGVTLTAAVTGTGKMVLDTTPTLVTPILGVATATSINKLAITAPATSATLTVADGASLVTSGAYSLTLTSTASTNVTFPTTGTLATLAGSETFTNKTLAAPKLSGSSSGTITLSPPAVAGTNTITVPAVTGTMVVLPTTVSMVQLYTANGQGSTNTAIRRFTNTITNSGSDITYADSASLGASFTINTNGIYAIHYGDSFNGAGQLGLSINTTQGATSIGSITDTNRIAYANTSAANNNSMVSATLYLASGSVIRPHAQAGTANGSVPASSTFLIVRIA